MAQNPFRQLFEENVDCDTPEKEEVEVKPPSLIHDSFGDISIMDEDKENIIRALALLNLEDRNDSGSDLGAESAENPPLPRCRLSVGAERADRTVSQDALNVQKQEKAMSEIMTEAPTQEQILGDVDMVMPMAADEELNSRGLPKPRPSLLSGFDPFYLSSPRNIVKEENLTEEHLLFFGNAPHDRLVASDGTDLSFNREQLTDILELSSSSPSVDSLVYCTPNISYVVEDQFELTITPERLSEEECSSDLEISKDDNQGSVIEKSHIEDIAKIAEEFVTDIVECAVHTVENSLFQEHYIIISKTMADVSDKLALQEEENAELKLQLNASQQVRATLELQLRQKEEVIIKSQAEAVRKDQGFKQEIKQLKEKLEEKCLENDNSQTKDLQELIKSLKAREAKLLNEVCVRKNDELNYRKIMDEYEKTIAAQLSELQKLNEEHETVKRHLANLELAFSDVHQKYERSKKIIDGYKCNEDALRQTLVASEDTVIKSEEKYESLKAHAKAQIEKSNQEMQLMRDQYDSEIHKLSAIIRRLEIKNASLTDSLDQKTKECSALAALCDEVTGKV